MPNVTERRRASGFTLVELLLVATLSALIAAGLAEWLHLFGRALAVGGARGVIRPRA